jgi:hypothetical protein
LLPSESICGQALQLLLLFVVSDIAVGAPYEGAGAVYIYHGDKSGIHFDPVQKILAEDIDPRLKGFGISLSNGVDVDGNHYNGMFTLITTR